MQQTELKLQMTIMAIMTFQTVRCLLKRHQSNFFAIWLKDDKKTVKNIFIAGWQLSGKFNKLSVN